jgi:hypothetical protein
MILQEQSNNMVNFENRRASNSKQPPRTSGAVLRQHNCSKSNNNLESELFEQNDHMVNRSNGRAEDEGLVIVNDAETSALMMPSSAGNPAQEGTALSLRHFSGST